MTGSRPLVLVPALLALVLALAACSGGRSGASRVTPPDPPPVPLAKPLKPLSSAAWRVPEAEETAASGGERLHVITAGQSLYAVSRLYDIPVRQLIAYNRLAPPYKLAIGQRLMVPAAGTPVVQTAAVQAAAVQTAPLASQPERPVAAEVVPTAAPAHLVKSGDTVYSIARRYRVDMAELVRLNSIPASYSISPGQRLLLPGGGGSAVAGLAADPAKLKLPATTSSTTPAPQPTLQPAAQIAAVPPPEVSGPVGKAPPRAGDKFLWPVEGKLVTGYGPKKDGLHNDGINIAAPRGSPVLAAENGIVAYVGNELRGFGNLLLIKHDGGWMTAYAHNEAVLVGRGAKVTRGQTVARVGDSGSVVTPQLHFEIRRGIRAVDPRKLLGPRQSAQNM